MGITNALGTAEKDYQADDDGKTNGEKMTMILRKREIINRTIEVLDEAWKCVVAHFVGEHEMDALKGLVFARGSMIDYAYNFLMTKLRQSNHVFGISQVRMLKVGMTETLVYEGIFEQYSHVFLFYFLGTFNNQVIYLFHLYF